RMVVFGGSDGFVLSNKIYARDLSGGQTWTQVAIGGTPPSARIDHAAVYDPVRNLMLVFGGLGSDGQVLNDLWALPLATSSSWSLLHAHGAPDRRSGATAIYDPNGDRFVIFGGVDSAGVYRNDVWAIALSDTVWTEITPAGPLPPARTSTAALYDPFNQRLVIF